MMRYFITIWLSFVGLLLVGCMSVEGEPTAVVAPTLQPSAIPPSVPTDLPTTVPTATYPPSTPTPEPLSLTSIAATQTVVAATQVAEIYLGLTPDPTATPLPTYTPYPGPVFQILFAGTPCISPTDNCNVADAIWVNGVSWYQIASDGSGLRQLEYLAQDNSTSIRTIRFSDDGSQMAYRDHNDIFIADLANTHPTKLVSISSEEHALVGGFDFVPDSNCLIVYWNADFQRHEYATITIQKVCPDETEPEILEVIELPDLRSPTNPYLSPQGDAILIRGGDNDGNFRFYIYELESGSPPTLVFMESQEVHISPFRWHPSGEYIELIVRNYPSRFPEAWGFTYHAIDRTGAVLEMTYPIEIPEDEISLTQATEWSAFGTEILVTASDIGYEQSGLYIYNISNGSIRQILPQFAISEIFLWSPEFP